MAALTIRGLDEQTHARLRVEAARHGRSMEAEVRAILRERFTTPAPEGGLGTRIHERFAALGGTDLELPARDERPRAAEFDA
ncbi:MAG: toxin-antitoxin system [Streptosporangiaceae bacterium]|nr:toxin-antitoxin system [Streptosporangiaceae bacterium]MBV9855108.1 toxin-antitoxin system [Streptosporangiaceae bacterium]